MVAPLLPKLRGQFAEFLNHSSPDRLGILYLTTCVGLGYGPRTTSLEAFLGSIGSSTSPDTARRHVSPLMPGGFAYPAGYTLTPGQPPPGLDYLPASPHRSPTHHKGPNPTRVRSEDPPHTKLVSVAAIGVGVVLRVREYQPVIHRLRLSASP
jgi:hypothetical protein